MSCLFHLYKYSRIVVISACFADFVVFVYYFFQGLVFSHKRQEDVVLHALVQSVGAEQQTVACLQTELSDVRHSHVGTVREEAFGYYLPTKVKSDVVLCLIKQSVARS